MPYASEISTSPHGVSISRIPKLQQDVAPRDLSHIERNLDKLLQTLAERCKAIFDEAARAAARSAVRVAGSVNSPNRLSIPPVSASERALARIPK